MAILHRINTNVKFDSNYLNHKNSQGKIAKRNSRLISYVYIGKEHLQFSLFENNKKAWPKTIGDCLKSLYSIMHLIVWQNKKWMNKYLDQYFAFKRNDFFHSCHFSIEKWQRLKNETLTVSRVEWSYKYFTKYYIKYMTCNMNIKL